jgi:hypothetical protein
MGVRLQTIEIKAQGFGEWEIKTVGLGECLLIQG